MKKIKQNGLELEITENEEFNESPTLSFYDWVTRAPDPSARAAWDYKQGEIDIIIEEWNESILFGKDKLKETIDSMVELNNNLKARIKELEGNGKEDISSR